MRRNLGFAGIAVVACAVAYWFLRAPPSLGSESGERAQKSGVLSWIFGAKEETGGEGSPATSDPSKKKPVGGIVVDAITGEPVAGAKVALRKSDTDVAEAVSGEDGRFAFDDRYDAYGIFAHKAGYAAFGARLDFSTENRLELDLAVRVSGLVVDEHGDPVENADVWIEDDDRSHNWPRAESSHVRTLADGRFEIVDAPAGDLIASAEHETFADGSKRIGGLAAGRVRDGVQIEMQSSAMVSGTVHSATGAPAAGVAVSWREKVSALISEETTETDEHGNFTLRVDPGRGAVMAVSDDGDASIETEASIAKEVRVVLTLTGQEALVGRVVDESDAPVAGATVELSSHLAGKSRRSETVSGADGRFELRAPPAASVQITAKKGPAFGKAWRKKGEELVVRVQAFARLRVRLVGEDGEKSTAPGNMYGKAADGRTRLEMAAEGGDIVLTGPPGEWTVFVQVRGGGTQETKVTTALERPDASVDIVVKTSAALGMARGRIEGQDGEVIPGAHVSAARMEGKSWGALVREAAVRSDVSGHFALPAPPGTQTLFVFHPEHRSEWVTVSMPPSGDEDVGTVRLKRGRSSEVYSEAVGIGVQFESTPVGPPKVRFVFEDTPAEKAGIRYGDVFLEADGVPLTGMPMKDILPRTQGAEGTTVRLRIQREGGAPFDLDIVRARYRT